MTSTLLTCIVVGFLLAVAALCVWENYTEKGKEFKKDYEDFKNDI